MRKLVMSIGAGAILAVAVGATALAAAPDAARAAGGAIADLLGLTRAQVQEMRQDGRSLADIATDRGVATQAVVDSLASRWTVRIEARLEAGALTRSEADALLAQVETRAREMATSTEPGGMGGAAVGAGRGAMGAGGGGPYGDGTCDGTGPHGPGAH